MLNFMINYYRDLLGRECLRHKFNQISIGKGNYSDMPNLADYSTYSFYVNKSIGTKEFEHEITVTDRKYQYYDRAKSRDDWSIIVC